MWTTQTNKEAKRNIEEPPLSSQKPAVGPTENARSLARGETQGNVSESLLADTAGPVGRKGGELSPGLTSTSSQLSPLQRPGPQQILLTPHFAATKQKATPRVGFGAAPGHTLVK